MDAPGAKHNPKHCLSVPPGHGTSEHFPALAAAAKDESEVHRVLICEDDPLLAADLAAIVVEAGHAVCGVFHNAQEALNSATELKPDLAIIDLTLADGDTGGALARTLQSRASASLSCRAIRTSASVSAASRTRSPRSLSARKS